MSEDMDSQQIQELIERLEIILGWLLTVTQCHPILSILALAIKPIMETDYDRINNF